MKQERRSKKSRDRRNKKKKRKFPLKQKCLRSTLKYIHHQGRQPLHHIVQRGKKQQKQQFLLKQT